VRRLAACLAVALLACACGGGSDPKVAVDPTTGATTFPASTGPSSTTIEATTGSTAPTATAPPTTTAGPATTATTAARVTPAPTGAPPAITLAPIATVEAGTAIATRDGDGAIYVTEQAGRIRAVRDGRLDPTPVLDLTDRVLSGGERGLLGLAFSADGATLYAYWTATQPTGQVTIAAFPMGAATADKAGQRVLVTVPHATYGNHNGGILMRGPDGFLYAGIGDGGSGGDPNGNGQNTSALLGKVIRIDPTKPAGGRPYGIPPGNPFASGGGAPEVWAYGLRNPWRLSFDPASDTLWIADVGQDQYEEIDRVPAGQAGVNYGWRNREGLHAYNGGGRPSGAVDPIAELDHGGGFCSVTGGYVYRGKAIPGLVGRYVFADYCAPGIRTLTQRGATWVVEKTSATAAGVRTFGVEQSGELLVIDGRGLSRVVAG
jgi:glucose/arabinose dehydrogenase